MSGFAAIVNFDGAPADRGLGERLVEVLDRRGPSARRLHVEGPVLMVHTLLRATSEASREHQPWSDDGVIWIAGHVRLDGLHDLARELAPRAGVTAGDLLVRPDIEWVALAYRAWGEACLEHLSGEFAFVIWDARLRRVLAARDQFGVRPLFYARVGRTLLVSNTLDAVRVHPAVSAELDESFVADFLLFGRSLDTATSVLRAVRRVPPAHRLTAEETTVALARYWSFPIDPPLRYARPADYVDHFRHVLDEAVADRVRFDRVSLMMSGGLDSTAIAASAVRARGARPVALKAFTAVYDRQPADEEGRYASMAARALGLSLRQWPVDDDDLFAHWDSPGLRTPEPMHQPAAREWRERLEETEAHSPVLLTGHGGDPLFSYMTDVAGALRSGDLRPVMSDVVRSLVIERRLPPVGVRTTVRRLSGRRPRARALPSWIDPDVARRLNLADRFTNPPTPVIERRHPRRADAQSDLLSPAWPALFGFHDAAMTGVAVERRYPFFDLRVVRFLMSVPPVPWLSDKHLLREASVGRLPNQIVVRPKAPLRVAVEATRLENASVADRLRRLVPAGMACPCLAATAFPLTISHSNLWLDMRPLSLFYFLRWCGSIDRNPGTVSIAATPC